MPFSRSNEGPCRTRQRARLSLLALRQRTSWWWVPSPTGRASICPPVFSRPRRGDLAAAPRRMRLKHVSRALNGKKSEKSGSSIYSRNVFGSQDLSKGGGLDEMKETDGGGRYSNPFKIPSGLGYYGSSGSLDDTDGSKSLKKIKKNVDDFFERLRGKLLYKYYQWREDTWSDLQLLLLLNVVVFIAGSWMLAILHEPELGDVDGSNIFHTWWLSLYNVMKIVFGQDMPEAAESTLTSQLFAAGMVATGLASFALVLALVEQVVLEVIQNNVAKGSKVYDEGHVVLLAWCQHAQGSEQCVRIMLQLAKLAMKNGPMTVVVLTQRDKLEMESTMRRSIPPESRRNISFIFRRGNPLDPQSLEEVSISTASSIIIAGDYDKREVESDAQCVRTAIVVDEMINAAIERGMTAHNGKHRKARPTVVCQVKNREGLERLVFACANRVQPIPTKKLNARRIARLLNQPIAAPIIRRLTDMGSRSSIGFQAVQPILVDKKFKEMLLFYPQATVLGLVRSDKTVELNPPPNSLVSGEDTLILSGFKDPPLLQPLKTSHGTYCGSEDVDTHENLPTPEIELDFYDTEPEQETIRSWSQDLFHHKRHGHSSYKIPIQYVETIPKPIHILICGWNGRSLMQELLREMDHGKQAVPSGSTVVLVNVHEGETLDMLDDIQKENLLRHIFVSYSHGDPQSIKSLELAIDIRTFDSALVLCDASWYVREDSKLAGTSSSSRLRLDALTLMAQLNIRMLLEKHNLPDINIISEKSTYVECRFEDTGRVPLGISINSASYSAKLLSQSAVDSRFLPVLDHLGLDCDISVIDSSVLSGPHEVVSYLDLQLRAAERNCVLLGFYEIPESMSGLDLVINPTGEDTRTMTLPWNANNRIKLLTLSPKRRMDGPTASAEDLEAPRPKTAVNA